MKLMKNYKKIYYLLAYDEQKKAGWLLIMILIMSIIDMLGVASIMPFMAVLTNTSLVETNIILNKMFLASSKIGVKTNEEFVFAFGILVFVFLVFSLNFKALVIYSQLRFIQMREYSISKRLVETYLHQPYSWFLNRNSAELGKSILSETGLIISLAISPLINLITQLSVSIALIILLLLIDLKLTLIISSIICGSYILIFIFYRKFLSKIGDELLYSNKLRFKFISEAFGSIKEVKLRGLEKIFVKRFSDPANVYAKNLAKSNIIGQLPRYFIETIAFGGMMMLVLYIISTKGTFASAIPIIAVYAFAGYRLIPSIQQIFQASTSLKFSNASVENLYNDLNNLKKLDLNIDQNISSLKNSIILKNINYQYPNTSRKVLKDINIVIPAYKSIGLVGNTGCGKTTIVDIIIGLLEPQKGTLEIDDKLITKSNLKAWQRFVGYVPQQIYLSDNSIAENIAFGVDLKNINQSIVEKVSKVANLNEFVINELPDKYQTIIGEHGVRLSGGQRQRIGIARALYHEPKVLILDEATSALDNKTEHMVMETLDKIKDDITIIKIAHRLNSVKKCDIIFYLENGQVKAKGSYDELIKINHNFRLLANKY